MKTWRLKKDIIHPDYTLKAGQIGKYMDDGEDLTSKSPTFVWKDENEGGEWWSEAEMLDRPEWFEEVEEPEEYLAKTLTALEDAFPDYHVSVTSPESAKGTINVCIAGVDSIGKPRAVVLNYDRMLVEGLDESIAMLRAKLEEEEIFPECGAR